MDETGSLTHRAFVVAPASRFSLWVEDVAEEGHDISTIVTSDLDIVVERPVYFLFSPQSL